MQRALTPIVAGLTTDFNITRSGVNGSGLFQALVLRFSTVAEVTAGLARRVVPTGGEHPDRGRRVERVSEGQTAVVN